MARISNETTIAARLMGARKLELEGELQALKSARNGSGYSADTRTEDELAGRIRGLDEARSLLLEALVGDHVS